MLKFCRQGAHITQIGCTSTVVAQDGTRTHKSEKRDCYKRANEEDLHSTHPEAQMFTQSWTLSFEILLIYLMQIY